ncbi:MAG: hypothetical protein ABJB03_00375 [Rhodoglobus sp.]
MAWDVEKYAVKPDIRECWRCGVIWEAFWHYIADAPCKDCREFLKKVDNDTTTWRGSPSRAREEVNA